ncbi:MAG: hypothetical protein WKF52_05540 [Sphingomicrobium sp.]
MSDGPYKSLPMKPRWRHASKCAYKEAFSLDEIVESVTRASHADWRAEVRQALIASVSAVVAPLGQQALFPDQAMSDLAALRRGCASPLEASFVSNAIDAVASGRMGGDAVQFAAAEALSDRLLCNYRQVEEHVRRDDSVRNAAFVRHRFAVAHGQIDLLGLARAALRTREPLPRRSRAQFMDLDAGVQL